jgi:hypothetical protein
MTTNSWTWSWSWSLAAAIFLAACGGDDSPAPDGGGHPDGGGPGGPDGGGGPGSPDGGGAPLDTSLTVHLVPNDGVTGAERVSFGLPLARGQLSDPSLIVVSQGGTELPAARQPLATHPDGSLRGVLVQIDLELAGETDVDVTIGQAPTTTDLSVVDPAATLLAPDGESGPRVWAVLPASWLSASGVVGPAIPASEATGAAAGAWDSICDYAAFDTAEFLTVDDTQGPWLYDRPTAMYRGYAITGDLVPLRSAFVEAHIYRNGLTGTGSATRIGAPLPADDLKYHYTQGMAIHYLLSGDARFRESAEDVATRAHDLWPSPGYAGGDDFWTERHAGFGLLAYVWAAIVSDDEAATFADWADEAVTAYLEVQATSPPGWTDQDNRCFAHTATSAGEDFGTWGCSPWLSAILADGLEEYAILRGGSEAALARDGIVKLGRILARSGLDGGGKPYYWMGVGEESVVDDFDEHWGEPTYVIAMAWHRGGRAEQDLRDTVDALLGGLAANGVSPHVRSFNWQCRSAPLLPYYLE